MIIGKGAYLLNLKTGEETKLIEGNHIINWCNEDVNAINICNSYNFECYVDLPLMNQAAKDLFFSSLTWRTICSLRDKLNDLIEEYHAPGNTRRQRRILKREFDRSYNIFRAYCIKYKIDYKFCKV